MCHEIAHFISSCPILAEYTWLRKVSRNAQNFLVLGNSDLIPNDLMNWATRVNVIYTRNPHLLKDPPPHIQAKFSANFLEVHRKSPLREENSSLFALLDSINEEDEELSSLGGKNETEKLQLNRYIKVLQIKTWARNHQIFQLWQQINWFGQQMLPWQKRPIHCQKFRLPQLSHF